MNDINLAKADLRAHIKNEFKKAENKEIVKQTKLLLQDKKNCISFWNSINNFNKYKTIFGYLEMYDEFPMQNLLTVAHNEGKNIGLPVVQGNTMIFRECNFKENILQDCNSGAFGILEPNKNNLQLFPTNKANNFLKNIEDLLPLLVLTPGRAFSENGFRMGRGGGFYDKFFADLFSSIPKHKNNDISLIGVTYSFQLIESIPINKTDIPVHKVLTEKIFNYYPRSSLISLL